MVVVVVVVDRATQRPMRRSDERGGRAEEE